MSTDVVSTALLQFSTSYTYPESEDVVTAELTSTTLNTVLDDLRKQREDVKQEIRSLSKTNGPNVESWIDQAKKLQQDIQKSREIARQIVEQHEDGQKLTASSNDAQSKIGLLQREITFEESLQDALQQIKGINSLLAATHDDIVHNKLEEAHGSLRKAKDALAHLGSLRDARSVVILRERGKRLQISLEEAVEQSWDSIFVVDPKDTKLSIESEVTETHPSLAAIGRLAGDLGHLDTLTLKLSRKLERAILKPIFSKSGSRITSDNSQLQVQPGVADLTLGERLGNLQQALTFIHTHTDEVVSARLFASLLPKIFSQVIEAWLEPAIPVDIPQIKAFESSVTSVSTFIEFLHGQQLGDAAPLQAWLDTLPKAWITKRRETLLSEARNTVFQRIHQTKLVERIESQMVSKDDAVAAQMEGGDDWDTAWDDDEQQEESAAAPVAEHDDDDDSAWDMDDSSHDHQDENEDNGSAWDVEDSPQDKRDATEDAWGWGEENGDSSPRVERSSKSTPSLPAKTTQRELTMKETYTVTAVPDEVLQLVKRIIADAQELASDPYGDSSLAVAAVGLYSLPTLALAIYRATAPTAYAKLGTGNMLIYNDATRLSEKLREWQAEQPAASRLRLDNDAKALDLFAKQAYSAEMESQKTILRDILDGAQGFSNCISPPFRQACEGAVDQVADRLNDVFSQWKAVLGANALLQSLGQLLSSVTGKMISEIQDLGDIGEEDSKQLKLLCEKLSVVKALFAQHQADGELRDMTFVYCPNWLKFQYLAEILESSLADIKFLWNEGELSLEFSSDEVIDLIKALFADSDHRRKLIAELRRQSRQ